MASVRPGSVPVDPAAVTRGAYGRRLHVSRGRFRRYVQQAVAALPPPFRAVTRNVLVVVESSPRADDFAPGERAGSLFGIYRGIPLNERTAGYHLAAPDVIAVFRRPLLRACRRRRTLREEVRRTVFHEFGHYLGLPESAVEHV